MSGEKKLRVGFFGGTFNPPHLAHMKLAETFVRTYGLDKLYICPNFSSYYKSDTKFRALPDHRYNMCKLAFSDFACEAIIVSDMEIRRGGNSYTVDTVRELYRMHPQIDTVYVLCGTDMIQTLGSWYEADELFKLATFVHAQRNGSHVKADAETEARSKGAVIEKMSFEPMDISSTSVRNDIFRGKRDVAVSDNVYDYIRRNLLYKTDNEYDLEKIRIYAKEHETEKRYRHTLGVMECALRMREQVAPQLSENQVAASALLHDITKNLSPEEHLHIFTEAGIKFGEEENNIEKVYHSRSGAITAKKLFGVSDTVYNSIWNHTTGDSSMTVLDKIIFLADFIEDNRTDSDCVELRDFYNEKMKGKDTLSKKLLAFNETMLRAFDITIEYLQSQGSLIHENTIKARNAINNETIRYRRTFS